MEGESHPSPRDCMVGSHGVHTSATRFFEERALKPKPIMSSSCFNHSCCSPGLRGPACLPFLVQHLPLHSHPASLSGPLSLPLASHRPGPSVSPPGVLMHLVNTCSFGSQVSSSEKPFLFSPAMKKACSLITATKITDLCVTM